MGMARFYTIAYRFIAMALNQPHCLTDKAFLALIQSHQRVTVAL